jgi:hypothetical protein
MAAVYIFEEDDLRVAADLKRGIGGGCDRTSDTGCRFKELG